MVCVWLNRAHAHVKTDKTMGVAPVPWSNENMVSGQCRLGAITNSITWPPPRSNLSPPFTARCLNSL